MLTREAEADALDGAGARITSAIAVFESVLGLCRKRHGSVEEAAEALLFKGDDFGRTDITAALR
jgi:uncharacterized protein with PIN domain